MSSPATTRASGLVALLTDFGLADPYVGIMKGVMLARHPNLVLVDLTHGVPPQNIALAGFWLARSTPFTGAGAVHLVVVDPGVGTERRAVAARARGQYFVGPDNGIWEPLRKGSPDFEARAVEPERVPGAVLRSATFHGRDLFAPLAAELAANAVDFSALGPEIEPAPGRLLGAVSDGAGVRGSVVHVDHFGNLVTDIGAELLAGGRWSIIVGDARLALARTYGDVARGALVALVNSFGTVEVAVRDGNAAARLGAREMTPVLAHPAD
jgi:hypothetical protein